MMTNQEHLDKLEEGVDVWNQWRDADKDMKIDLRGADLHDASLCNVNFYKTDLSGADLRGADLSNSRLSMATLNNACLHGARLDGAILNSPYLYDTDLSSTSLYSTHFFDIDMHGVNFKDSYMSVTLFSLVDLSQSKGLLEVHHKGPSIIDLYSVLLPQDGSALHFLRGTGISNKWIDFYRATMQQPIQYHSCFISYSSEDYEIAKRLHADLQDQGVRCWFAPHDLVPGDYFREKIDQAIHMQDKLLLILSTHSMNSTWVQHEVRKALNREANQNRTILFPISLDGSVFKSPSAWAQELREERHIGDFTQWETYEVYKQKFQTLLKQLKATEVQP